MGSPLSLAAERTRAFTGTGPMSDRYSAQPHQEHRGSPLGEAEDLSPVPVPEMCFKQRVYQADNCTMGLVNERTDGSWPVSALLGAVRDLAVRIGLMGRVVRIDRFHGDTAERGIVAIVLVAVVDA